jgi:predicted DCC family thiol-disulfide oxidoreductase YuxK
VTTSESPTTLTVLYDGSCPLCRTEISYLSGLAERHRDSALCFVDISDDTSDARDAAERKALLARFHVEHADGTRLDGAAAFVAMWERLPGWRWLAFAGRLPGATWLMEQIYRLFLRLRPVLQRWAARWD